MSRIDDPAGATADSEEHDAQQRERPSLARGACVDRYLIVTQLGAGGMGVVYKAFDPELGRPVALKLLNAKRGSSEALRDRLMREAQALARLSHPNVVAVHDVGTFGDDVFVAMEFVEGQTLREWLKERPRSQREILDVFFAAGQGLAAAHRAALVHRDFKPDNVIVGSDGRVRVFDFGLARDTTTQVGNERGAAAAASEALVAPRSTSVTTLGVASGPARPPSPPGKRPAVEPFQSLSTPLTYLGTIMGTPRYMAPEQHCGDVADARADQFSFCVSLYEALYGQLPFAGTERDDFDEFKDNVIHGRIREPPAGTHVARWVRPVLHRGLAVKPTDRYESMDVLLGHVAPARNERALWTGISAVAFALGLTVWGVLGWRSHVAERAQLCQGAPGRLVGVWDAPAKARVREALLATGKSYAADAWTSVEKALDRYTASWVQMHKESCEATRLRGDQTDAVMALRMACLDRKLQGASALVNVLAHADSAVLGKAGSAAAQLSSLEECGDASGLLAEVSLPSDPALRERVSAIRAELSSAEAFRLAGRIRNAVDLSEKAVAEARATGNPVILAEALTQEGHARASLEPERSAHLQTEAYWPAFANRHDRTAVAAAILAARGYALTLHSDEAALWEKLAQAGLDRMGGDDELESELWSARSVRALEMRHFDDELQAAARAARLSERRFGFDDLRTIAKQENELNAMSDVSRLFEAWQRRGPLIERQEKQLGPKHPTVADALMDLGDDEVNIGHLAEARAHLRRSEALYRDLGQVNSVGWTTLRSYEVRLAEAEGRNSDLQAIGRETLATFERTGRGGSDMALFLRIQLAVSDSRQGHAAEAIGTLQGLMRDAQSSHGKDYSLTFFHSALAKIHLRRGDLTAARQEAENALASALHHAGEGSCPVAEERLILARVLVAQGHAADALALANASEPVLTRAFGDRAPAVATSRRIRGEALAALGRFDDAAAALQSSLAIEEADGLDPARRQETRAVLALALAKTGRPSDRP